MIFDIIIIIDTVYTDSLVHIAASEVVSNNISATLFQQLCQL